MYMASITLLLFSISTRQMNKANKTEREKCTFFLLRHATSSESFPCSAGLRIHTGRHGCQRESELPESGHDNSDCKKYQYRFPGTFVRQTWEECRRSLPEVPVASVRRLLAKFPGIKTEDSAG